MTKTTKILFAVLIATLLGGGGYFYLKLAKKQVIPPVNEGQIEVRAKDIPGTEDWKYYVDLNNGYAIKYPQNWLTIEQDDHVVFLPSQYHDDYLSPTPKSYPYVYLSTSVETSAQSIRKRFAQEEPKYDESEPIGIEIIFEKEKLNLQAFEAYRFTSHMGAGKTDIYIISLTGKVYLISTLITKNKFQEYSDTLQKMLATIDLR